MCLYVLERKRERESVCVCVKECMDMDMKDTEGICVRACVCEHARKCLSLYTKIKQDVFIPNCIYVRGG